ncbi:MAG: RDD family protein [Actinomycetota bacterium]|nr:RDD family protein [Actinomycetota bacterium]
MSDQGSYGHGGDQEWGRPPAWGEQPRQPQQPPAWGDPHQQQPARPTWAASQDPNDPYGQPPQAPSWGGGQQQPPQAPGGGYGAPQQPQPPQQQPPQQGWGAPQAPGGYGAPQQPQPPQQQPSQQYGAPQQFGGVPTPDGGYGAPAGNGQAAEYGSRVVAYLIDIGIIIGVAIVGMILSAILGAIVDVLGLLVSLVAFVAYIGVGIWNMIILQGNTGQSIGKKSQGIKLVNESGQPLGPAGAFIRYLVAGALSGFTCGIGGLADVLWPLFDEDKKRLTDKILKNSVDKV